MVPKGKFIFDLRDRKLISKWCIYHIVHVKKDDVESPSLDYGLIVKEFPDIFAKRIYEVKELKM